MMTAESETVATDAPRAAPNLADRSILVVDDDPIQRVLMMHAFWDVDATFYQAEDGEGALSLITSKRPDLVIMDARMPKLSGREVLAALDRVDHPIKLILTSGNTLEFGMMVANRANVVAVIEKPVRLKYLRRIVFEALGGDAQS